MKTSVLQFKITHLDRPSARRILESSITAGLREVVGTAGLKLVSMRITPDMAAEDPRRFHEVLVSIFMEKGAVLIENKIASRLLERLGRMDISHGLLEKLPEGNVADPEVRRHLELLKGFANTTGKDLEGHAGDSELARGSFAEVYSNGH